MRVLTIWRLICTLCFLGTPFMLTMTLLVFAEELHAPYLNLRVWFLAVFLWVAGCVCGWFVRDRRDEVFDLDAACRVERNLDSRRSTR